MCRYVCPVLGKGIISTFNEVVFLGLFFGGGNGFLGLFFGGGSGFLVLDFGSAMVVYPNVVYPIECISDCQLFDESYFCK